MATIYTQAHIEHLISCSKTIVEEPRKAFKSDFKHQRNDMRLRSEDEEHDFRIFMRINVDFPENFSIGLVLIPKDERGEICLFRCNGPHGPYDDASFDAHFAHHVHTALADNVNEGLRDLKGSGQRTTEYASFEEALAYFLKKISIKNSEQYFPDIFQRRFDFEENA